MNDEIIIDGVNVAECYFYYNGECRCELNCIDLYENKTIIELAQRSPEHNYMECKPSENCYFKKLKRLEAEKQDLIDYFELRESGMQEDIQYWKNKAQELYKQLEKYKAENEKLREHLKKWQKFLSKGYCDCEVNESLRAENEKLKKEIEKMRIECAECDLKNLGSED